MHWSRVSSIASLTITIAAARPTLAQQADMIRGRVTAQDGASIDNARVTVTSIPNNVSKSTTTDKGGRYAITFPSGDGDYWITISAIGFAQRRFELKRVADEAVLLGDVKLSPSGVTLDAVKVQAERARPNRNGVPDISGTEKTVGSAAVDPSQAGNLAAMAASVPGVQLIPGAEGNPDQFSVFGLSGDQNSTTLNGLGFGGSDIPRDATTRATLGTSPWDVSRGGFSGAQMGLSTQAGSNFSTRGLSTLLNTPSAQWTDRAGRSLGAQYTSASLGAATAGPVSMDKSFYSVGYQFDRRMSDLPTLADADETALNIAGVAADSVARLRSILGRVGAPVAVGGLPSTKVSDRGLLLANFDWAPPTSTTGQAFTVTAATSFVRLNAPFAQVTAAPDERSADEQLARRDPGATDDVRRQRHSQRDVGRHQSAARVDDALSRAAKRRRARQLHARRRIERDCRPDIRGQSDTADQDRRTPPARFKTNSHGTASTTSIAFNSRALCAMSASART